MYIDFFLCYGLSCSFESRLHACRMKASNLSNSPFHSSDTRKNLGPKNLLPGPLPMSFAWRLRHTQIKKKSGTYPYPCYCQLVRGMLGYHTVGFITSSIYNHFKSFRYYQLKSWWRRLSNTPKQMPFQLLYWLSNAYSEHWPGLEGQLGSPCPCLTKSSVRSSADFSFLMRLELLGLRCPG